MRWKPDATALPVASKVVTVTSLPPEPLMVTLPDAGLPVPVNAGVAAYVQPATLRLKVTL